MKCAMKLLLTPVVIVASSSG